MSTSVSPGSTTHKSPRWALICKVPSASTVVAYCHGGHAVPAHMTHLIACAADNIAVTATAAPSSPFCQNFSLGALPGNMARYIAQVADGFIPTLTGQVACLSTVVAGLLICAVNSNMALLVAVVTEPQITGRQLRSQAFPCTMARFATCMTYALIWAITGHVAWFSAIPT